MPLEFAGATDVGRKRDHNEDALLLAPQFQLAVVCDGMGGHQAGEVASGIGVATVRRFFEIAQDPDATWPYGYDRQKAEERLESMPSPVKSAVRLTERAVGLALWPVRAGARLVGRVLETPVALVRILIGRRTA